MANIVSITTTDKKIKKPQRQFFRDINKWIQEGCQPHRTFYRFGGLCTNYALWCTDNCKKRHSIKLYFHRLGYDSPVYPFDDTIEDLLKEIREETIFQNPKRLAFIKKHI